MNPYAPPQEMPLVPGTGRFAGYGAWQDAGRVALYRTGSVLPDRCAICNAAGKHRVSKTFYWHEPWLYVLIVAGWLVYAIVALIVRKSANVEYWLCDEHRKRRTLGLVMVWVGFSVPLVGMLVAAGAQSGVLAVICLLLMIGMPIAGGLLARGVRPLRIDDSQVLLKAGEPFVASLPLTPDNGAMGYGAAPGGMGYGPGPGMGYGPGGYGPPPGAGAGSPYGGAPPPRW